MAGTTPKFNLTRLLNERSREAAVQENKEEKTAEIATPEDGVSSTADIYDLIPSKGNFYSVEDVQDLKQSIELLGVLQPLKKKTASAALSQDTEDALRSCSWWTREKSVSDVFQS